MKQVGLQGRASALAMTALASVALTNCGACNRAANKSSGNAVLEHGAPARLDLTSDAFQEGQPIPAQYTCDGAGRLPALKWSDPPKGTGSFALIVDDPDSPGGPFGHWGTFDIPGAARSLEAGEPRALQVVNDFGKPGYGGPCPPKGHGPHHYHFKLLALDTDKLPVPATAKVADLESAARGRAIGEGELIGTYERK